ncbi:Molybdopterin or thiamine biosynthesis adenylyltransferase [Polaribacter sp. KT25b]|uniref:ThiF family adenylyltransferase n=1 Tax=Polaribacter sp. KT25b TaxID=1855336 RepID=UPI00087A9145|nr:ThiF family adenylyltransferase [Polaribacter sp. KT25b]SDR66961.1 Molybdopterin or thiamine biosynthesis adenylyltransferase [Polaribacter sp. KT25b]
MDYSRIIEAVDIKLLQRTHIIVVGAGGSYSLVCSLARTGIGKITVLDFDTVEASNIVRQGYNQTDIGNYKVNALGKAVSQINPDTEYLGITKNFHDMNETELDTIFKEADLALFLTDSFKAQSFGNILALKYMIPAIWAGFYAKSRTAEIFFSIPKYTPSCFRCCCSYRYLANKKEEIKVSSNCNTIFHSQHLDSFIGFIALAILHKNHLKRKNDFEFASFFQEMKNEDGKINYNFIQFKVHPLGGNKLFDNAFNNVGMNAQNFNSYWQRIEAEIPDNGYNTCPDCKGKLQQMIKEK